MTTKNLVWIIVALVIGVAIGYLASLPIQMELRAKLNPDHVGRIKARGVLIVGTSADWPPFEYVDKHGNIVGIDIEIAKRIAKELGVRLEVKDMKFAALIEALRGGLVDLVIADMSATAKRGKLVDFSIPYYYSKEVAVVVPADKVNKYKGIGDLVGKKIGVQLGTVQEDWAKSTLGGNATIISYDRVYPEMVMALQRGDIDAMALGEFMANVVVKKIPGLAVAFYAGGSRGAAIALPHGAYDLKYVVNKVIEDLIKTGEMEKIFEAEITKYLKGG